MTAENSIFPHYLTNVLPKLLQLNLQRFRLRNKKSLIPNNLRIVPIQ